MIVKTGCKINLGLQILSKRSDGYHNISTIFYPITQIYDLVEVIPSNKDAFSSSGIEIDCKPEKNLCTIALKILRQYIDVPPCKIHLHKVIPYGTGLGAGSANAMGVIDCCNQVFGLNLSQSRKIEIASKIGSDVPFFAVNKPQIASGRGEILDDIDIDLKGLYIQISKPEGSISTKEAYSLVTPNNNVNPLCDIIKHPICEWKDILKNDFETSVFEILYEAKRLKENHYTNGAIYASLSGSGSAVFGIYKNKPLNKNDKLLLETQL